MTEYYQPIIDITPYSWHTPQWFYNEINNEFHFTLDPCPINPTFDGLSIRWNGNVYVNPPYTNPKKWITKAIHELPNCNVIVFLLPTHVDTTYYHYRIFKFADEIRFIKKRLYSAQSSLVIFKNPLRETKLYEKTESVRYTGFKRILQNCQSETR